MNSAGNREAWGRAWRRAGRRWEALVPDLRGATGWKIWNPGIYGERWHARFRRRHSPGTHPLLIFGLNPGPYGMAQTGIPFTDIRRLVTSLPELALELRRMGEAVEVPGLAPADLRPFLGRCFESSAVRVYRFLERGWGSAERGWSDVVVANPCTLLFVDPAVGKNRTPADLGKAARAGPGGASRARALEEASDHLRIRCATDAVEALDPRGVILFGKDVQGALGPALCGLLGEKKVIPWEHPARAVPESWSAGLLAAIRNRGLDGETSRPPGRSRK